MGKTAGLNMRKPLTDAPKLIKPWPAGLRRIFVICDDISGARKRRLTGDSLLNRITIRCITASRSFVYCEKIISRNDGCAVDMVYEMLTPAEFARGDVVVLGSRYSGTQSIAKFTRLQAELIFEAQHSAPALAKMLANMESQDAARNRRKPDKRTFQDILCDGLTFECTVLPTGLGSELGNLSLLSASSRQETHSFPEHHLLLLRIDKLTPGSCLFATRLARRTRKSAFVVEKQKVMDFCFPGGGHKVGLRVHSNIKISKSIEFSHSHDPSELTSAPLRLLSGPRIRVMELFAGVGGMAVGALLAEGAPPMDILYSAEVSADCLSTIRTNHNTISRMPWFRGSFPNELTPMDLTTEESKNVLKRISERAGGIDLLLAGPPCQGFSTANRRSRIATNPNNLLLKTCLEHISILVPRIVLIENVQGIVWTKDTDWTGGSAVTGLSTKLQSMGYEVHFALLDAARFGVPQHRTRFFLLAIRNEKRPNLAEKTQISAFPSPTHGPGTGNGYSTVGEALCGMPPLLNGEWAHQALIDQDQTPKTPLQQYLRNWADPIFVSDHIASKHADYVIERFKAVPPGKNWESIRDLLHNYANPGRTHSNIYRRLKCDEPAITLGHFRKSMIIHPTEDRGLSIREAARLQTFPDWFEFSTTKNGSNGLSIKQQQLANAVCPIVIKAIVEHLVGYQS